MVTENSPPMKRPRMEPCYANMEPTGRAHSPTAEKVSSAADAMLKLSNSTPNLPVFVMNPNLRSALTGGLAPIGQPPVAYKAQSAQDGAKTAKQTTFGQLHQQLQQQQPQQEQVDVKPDLQMLNGSQLSRGARRQREFIPDYKKDDHYWMKRRKNNEAAKRSREKRRMNDLAMGEAISKIQHEKDQIYRELRAVKRKFGLPLDQTFPYDDEPSYYSSSNSAADDSPNEGSQNSMVYSTDSNTPVFPSPIIQSNQTALQEVLSAAPKALPENNLCSVAAPLGTVQTTPAPSAIPFLIPVSGAPQPLALVANVTQAGFPVNPAIVASLSVSPEVLLTQNKTEKVRGTSTSTTTAGNGAPEVGTTNGADEENILGSDHNAAVFHSKLKGPEFSQPVSPESGSRGSVNIANQSSSASDYSECDTSDEHDGRRVPLNLCKRENEAAAQGYIEIKPIPSGGPKSEQAAIPHKLRHKLANYLKERGAYTEDATVNDVTIQQPLEAEASNGEEVCDGQYDSSSDGATDSPKFVPHGNTSIDPKYVERRRRNNMAARKCREQRKMATDQRVAKSSVLEMENERLKQELLNLTTEVSTLKELIEMKNAAKAQGKPFEPPVLKKICREESSNGQNETEPSGRKG